MEYYILLAKENGEVEVVREEGQLPARTAKCLTISMDQGKTIGFVIGWRLRLEEYLHANIYKRLSEKYGSEITVLGGGRVSYIDGIPMIEGKSIEYGKMDAAHVALYGNALGATIGAPYDNTIKII